MTFSASATHALRAVSSLAGAGSRQAVIGRDLAKRAGIPGHYLAKVLATLARSGILTASRGVKGGYRLARPADRIRLIDVVLPFEGERARPACLLRPRQACRESSPCPAHLSWRGVNQAFADFLERTTVADIQWGEADSGRERSRRAPSRVAAPRQRRARKERP